jgi:hypothetical protein
MPARLIMPARPMRKLRRHGDALRPREIERDAPDDVRDADRVAAKEGRSHASRATAARGNGDASQDGSGMASTL